MQNTSTAFKTAVISTQRTLKVQAVLQTADATIYNLGPGDIVAGSLSVDSHCFDDGIELGATVAADCSISLNNADGAWNNIDLDGATLWPYSGLVLPDTTTEYVKLGTFIIDEPGRPYSQLTLQASDRMILLDEPFSAVVLAFPATNAQILAATSVHCNVPLATSITGILNASYSVTTRPTDDITCRDVVGMIALMAAGFARTNRDGELEIVQLPNLSGTIAVEMPVGSRYEGFKQTADPVTVTGITYTDIEETVQLGTADYSLQIDLIPLLQDNRDEILQSIFDVIGGYTYTGFTCPYPGNPAIDPGDSVRHVTMDGKTIVSLVASHNFAHGGKSTMEATAKSQSSMSYKGANARRLSTIAKKIQAVDANLTTYQQTQAQFTDLLTQAMGYFVTEVPQLDGSTIHYEHDHPLLADSVVIYKKTSTTMSWTSDAGAHWYGMTAEGNILARVLTAIGINAEWVHISGASTYAPGYDPSAKETPAGAQAKADAAYASAQSFVNNIASGLQTQIDGSITTFFYAYVPLLTNVPANAWTTTAIKNQHLGDLFYDTSTGYSYRYQLVSTTYSWQRITDTDITTALANAATAQDTADHKRRVFVATPTTPYDIGDLWAGGSAGDLKKCSTARASGAYVAGDWTLASKYTDDTTANTAVTNAATAQTAATNAATVAAAKNKTFYTQPVPPYYIGDIWQKQQVPTAITDIVKCTVTRLTGVYTAADWANAYTLAEIAAMGSTIISGGYIKTSLLDVVNLIAGTLTNTATNPECWATIGQTTIGGIAYYGISIYRRSISATVPVCKLHIGDNGELRLCDKNDVGRFYADDGNTRLYDANAVPRFNADASSVRLFDENGFNRFYADAGTTSLIDSAGKARYSLVANQTFIRSGGTADTYTVIDPEYTKTFIAGVENQKVPFVGNQGFTYKITVVFGKNPHGGYYHSSMIPLPFATLYNITGLTVYILDGTGNQTGTTTVSEISDLGFSVKNESNVLPGQVCYVGFTITRI